MYRRKDLVEAIKGKVEIGPYDWQHLIRYAMIVREIQRLWGDVRTERPIRTLDFGSHTGVLSLALKELGYEAHGVDVEPVVNEYSAFYAKYDLKVKPLKSGYSLPYEKGYFDCVICSEVLEHIYDSPLEVLSEFKRVLKPEGYLVLTTPNVMRIENKLRFLLNINIYQDIERYTYFPRYALHFREYSRKDLKTLLEDYLCYSSVRVKMFDFVAGRSSLRRTIQRCLYSINLFLPMFRGTMLAIARNNQDHPPRSSPFHQP